MLLPERSKDVEERCAVRIIRTMAQPPGGRDDGGIRSEDDLVDGIGA
jgi:hypothetical protein